MSKEYSNTGIWSWITTVDHKRIGIMYACASLMFLVFGGVEAMLMRTQLIIPNNGFLGAKTFNALVTMHGTTMIFLFVMPLSAAFFNFLIPLMIGARDVAFPRLNALSFWIFFFGGLLLNFGFVIDQAPRGGWFGYANLSSKQFTPDLSMDFWSLGLQVVGLASLIAAINFFVTILNMRCKGMTLLRTCRCSFGRRL
jgi:cytochrome c oxidase subunit I